MNGLDDFGEGVFVIIRCGKAVIKSDIGKIKV